MFDKNEQVDSTLEDFNEAILNLGEVTSCIVENLQIQQALEMQDEVDRASIALMGYKETTQTVSGKAEVPALQVAAGRRSPIKGSTISTVPGGASPSPQLALKQARPSVGSQNASSFMPGGLPNLNVSQSFLSSPRLPVEESLAKALKSQFEGGHKVKVPSVERSSLMKKNFSVGKLPSIHSPRGGADASIDLSSLGGLGRQSSNQYIALDRHCISCSGQSSLVMSAFKIACLSYSPSPLTYR